MKNINSLRVFNRNNKNVREDGKFVLYWMQVNRRVEYNFALEYAVAWANKLDLPLLVYEGLRMDYPWASDRIHSFILEGMKENLEFFSDSEFSYFPFVESKKGEGKGLVKSLCEEAALIVSDEFPVFIIPEHNKAIAEKAEVPFYTVDSNGVLPMELTKKEPYSAFIFRRNVQKYFKEAYQNPPKRNPLEELKNRNKVELSAEFLSDYQHAENHLNDIFKFISSIEIDHSVTVLDLKGTREAALKQMDIFLDSRLSKYADERNHPDKRAYSGLSPYLHFGKISPFEIVEKVFERQPKGWSIDDLTPVSGKNRGYFKGHEYVESFMDEIITWREVGYHFAHVRPDYDKYESLPDWAKQSLAEHESDPREHIYSLEELENAQTHDEIWNAAQRQLVKEGIIHNYLRMLWGKNILAWTPNAKTALEYLIHLNNKYAIDGRNPNSYSGIFWILGRFDRAWGPERPVFGKIRYMTSKSTRSKLKLDNYLKEFSGQSNLGI